MKVVTAAGATIDLGTTETTPTISITDYSRRVTDDFGVTTVVERGFARRLSVRLAVPFDGVDALQRRLADLRATAATWVADDRFAWLSAKGFYRDFELDLAVPPISFCTLTVEGFAETEVGADPGGDPAPVGLQSTLQLLQPITVTDAALLTSSVAENDAPAWAAASTYAMGARVMRDHQLYESLIAGNVGAEPAKSPAAWLTVGPTNRWAMFDDALGTATEGDRRIEVTVSAGRFNAIALLDVAGATVRVRTTGYDRMQAVSTGSTTFLDIPAGDAQVTVTIAGPGAVSVGTLLIGTVVRLGATEAAPTAGITDYSRKAVDDFGEVTIVKRAWAKRMTARALIDTSAIDAVANRIAAVRARPSLWIGQEGIDSLSIYGFFKDFSIEVGETVSKLALSIEGMSQASKIEPITGKVDWPDVGDPNGTKPKDNADETGKNTSKDTAAVGGRPSGELINVVDLTKKAVETAQADVVYARSEIVQARTDLAAADDAVRKEVAAARGDVTQARADITQARSDLATEVQRAKDDTASIRTVQEAIQRDVSGAVSRIGNEETARASADSALANRSTALEARGGVGGGNMASNTQFVPRANNFDIPGWSFNPLNSRFHSAQINWPEGYYMRDENVLASFHGGPADGGYGDWYSEAVSVIPGQYVQYYAYVNCHRTYGSVFLYFYSQSGDIVGNAPLATATNVNNTGEELRLYRLTGVKSYQIPAGVSYARLILRHEDNMPGQSDGYCWFTRPYLGYAREGQTEFNSFVHGSSRSSLYAVGARVTDEATARANADSALADRAATLEAQFRGDTDSPVLARVRAEETARANADSALAGRAATLEAQFRSDTDSPVLARVRAEETARANADSALANRATTLEAQFRGEQASTIRTLIYDETTVRANADSALANRATTLEAKATYGGEQTSKTYPGFETRFQEWGFDTQASGRNAGGRWEPNHTKGAGLAFQPNQVGQFLYMDPAGWIKTTPGKRYRAGFWVWQFSAPNGFGGTARLYWEGQNAEHSDGVYLGASGNAPEATRPFYTPIPDGAWHCYASDFSVDDAVTAAANSYWIRPRINIDGVPAGAGYIIAGWFFREVTGEFTNAAKISEEAAVRVNADSALAGRAATLEAQFRGDTDSPVLARVRAEETARGNADSALAGRAATLEAQFRGDTDSAVLARVRAEETARANADSALANRSTALEARGGIGGGNMASNTQFVPRANNFDIPGWTFSRLNERFYSAQINWPEGYYMRDENVLASFHAGPPDGGYADWYGEPVSVIPGQYVQYYAYVNCHRTGGSVFLYFYDAGGSIIGNAPLATSINVGDTGDELRRYRQTGVKSYLIPPGVVYVRLILRHEDNMPGQTDGYCWFTRPYLGYAREGQSEWNSFVHGSSRSSLYSVGARITDEATARANADSALATRTGTLEAQFRGDTDSPILARIRNEETARAGADSALATRSSNLEARAGGLEARVGTAEGTLADVRTKVATAWSEKTVAVPGAEAAIRMMATNANGVATSDVALVATQIALLNLVDGRIIPALRAIGGNVVIANDLRGGAGRIIFDNGAVMKVMGTGFGSNGQFIEWFGPRKDDLAQCTEANATYYLKTDGSSYFGGSLRAGLIKNAVQTTNLATDANVTTGTVGSNGGTRSVVVTYSWSVNQQVDRPQGNESGGGLSASVILSRNGVDVMTLSVTGGVWSRTPASSAQEPGSYTEQMGGSITFTDNSGGSSVVYSARLSGRTLGPGPANGSSRAPNQSQGIGIVQTEG